MRLTIKEATKLLKRAGLDNTQITKKGNVKLPKAESELEATLAFHLKVNGITGWSREFRPWTDSRIRFDFVFLAERILIELDGFTLFGDGAHSKGEGYSRDCKKRNRAAIDGYTVLSYDKPLVMSGYAIEEIKKAVAQARAR
jgi:very-short-patch-repair endonuclease